MLQQTFFRGAGSNSLKLSVVWSGLILQEQSNFLWLTRQSKYDRQAARRVKNHCTISVSSPSKSNCELTSPNDVLIDFVD